MSMVPAGLAKAADLITGLPHGLVVLAFVVLVALVLILPHIAYRRMSRVEPPKEVTLVDPVFGKMRYEPEILYWRGRVMFAPLKREISVDLGADDEGLFEKQRGWYQEIERRYPSMQSEIERLVQSSSRCSETFDHLQLARVNFPDHPTENLVFALGYTSTSTRSAYWVTVENWKPTDIEWVGKRNWKPVEV